MNNTALSVVRHCYLEYSKYVNSTRALVDSRDGLKTVQRRILLTCGNINKKTKSAKVVGETLGNYHPHGDTSIYGALCNLVTNKVPLLTGQGSFGGQGVDGAAAMRYTGCELNSLGKIFLESRDYAPKVKNDLGTNEEVFLPTPIPYALLSGSRGIGVGVSTNILPCTIKSILSYLRSGGTIYPDQLGRNSILEISKEELNNFNNKGYCSVTISAKVEWQFHPDENKEVIVITGVPLYISPDRAELALRHEIEDGLIFVRDESTTEIKIIVARKSRIRRISDEELFKKVKRVYTKRMSFVNYVWDEGVIKIMTPAQMLDKTFNLAMKITKGQIENQIKNIEQEIKLRSLSQSFALTMLEKRDSSQFSKDNNLTIEEVKKLLANSLSWYHDSDGVAKLNLQSIDLNNVLNNIKHYYIENRIGKRFDKLPTPI